MALFFALPAFAQEADEQPRNIDEKADRITEMLTEALALSEDQREEVYEATQEMLEEKAEGDDTRGEILKEYDEELKEVLNDEQYAQYMEGDLRSRMMKVAKFKAHQERVHDKKDM